MDRPSVKSVGAATIRLTLIDEHVALGEGLALLFAQSGPYEMRRIGTRSEEILEHTAAWQPQVVIISTDLAGSRALHVLGQVRAQLPDCRILLWGDVCGPGDVRAAQRAGAAGFLSRRIGFAELECSVERAFRGEAIFPTLPAHHLAQEVTTEGGAAAEVEPLTPRELDVLCLLAQGLSLKQCAKLLERSVSTVDNHKCRLMRKLGLHSTVELTRFAIGQGLIQVVPPGNA